MKKLLFAFCVICFSSIAVYKLVFNYLPSSIYSEDELFSKSQTGKYDEGATIGFFHDQKFEIPPPIQLKSQERKILGFSTGLKRIYVDLTNQRVYAYEGTKQVFNYLISSGKWGRTPTGVFKIWSKFLYVKMSGGSREAENYYYLPNVPFTMFF